MVNNRIPSIDIPLDKENFFNELICELSGILDQIAGEQDSSELIAMVGQGIGHKVNTLYKQGLNLEKFSSDQVWQILIDLKKRLGGNFGLVSADDRKLVFRNDRCPFGKRVEGRHSLCMMTSNVFGVLASQNLGYAKVALHDTIARGSNNCDVVVYLKDTPESRDDDGREYYKVTESELEPLP